MRSKTKLGAVVGAVALALSAHAFANTGVGATGTIWLSIDDHTTSTEYFFDTGLSAQNFNGSATLAPISFAGGNNASNFSSFLSTIQGGNLSTSTDAITYSVIGAASAVVGTNTTQTRFVDFTSVGAPNGAGTNGASSTANVNQEYGNINAFLGALGNPSGGSSALGTAASSNQWFAGSGSANLDSLLVANNGGLLNQALGFYQATGLLPATTNPNGGLSAFAGSWSLNLATDALNYTVSTSTVPLPAPLLLLLSGLGAMGIVGRRNRAAA